MYHYQIWPITPNNISSILRGCVSIYIREMLPNPERYGTYNLQVVRNCVNNDAIPCDKFRWQSKGPHWTTKDSRISSLYYPHMVCIDTWNGHVQDERKMLVVHGL
jgi:hypothetical protein